MSKRLIALLLTVLMVLSTVTAAFAEAEGIEAAQLRAGEKQQETPEFPAADEAQEGETKEVLYQGTDAGDLAYVIHGGGDKAGGLSDGGSDTVGLLGDDAAGGLLGGIRDEDYPVISDFEPEKNGAVYRAGDTLKFRLKLTDANGIDPDRGYLYFSNADGDVIGMFIDKSQYDPATGYYSGEYLIDDSDQEGLYFLSWVKVYDTCGFYSDYFCTTNIAAQTVFPGNFIVQKKEYVTDLDLKGRGQTLGKGDKLQISFKLSEPDVETVDVIFHGDLSDIKMYYDNEDPDTSSITYDAKTDLYTGEVKITDDFENGDYYLEEIEFLKEGSLYGQTQEYSREDGYTVTLTGVSDPWITEISYPTGGAVFEAEDDFAISFKLNRSNITEITVGVDPWSAAGEIVLFQYRYGDPESTISYNPSDGTAAIGGKAGNLFVTGTYRVDSIQIGYTADISGSRASKYRMLVFDATHWDFKVAGKEIEHAAMITSLAFREEGTALKDNGTLNIDLGIDSGEKIEEVHPQLSLFQADEELSANQSSFEEGYDISMHLDAAYNPDTKKWEAAYTFKADDVYGVYHVPQVEVVFEDGTSLAVYPLASDPMILFEEDDTKTFKRLEKATDVCWNKETCALKFTLPGENRKMAALRIFNADTGKIYYDANRSFETAGEQEWNILCDVKEPETADLKFSVQLLGDGTGCYDSEISVSDILEFTLPGVALPAITDYRWSDQGEAVMTIPEGVGSLKLSVEFWYQRNDDAKIGSYRQIYDQVKAGETIIEKIPVGMQEFFGEGNYYFRAGLLSNNPAEIQNSPFTALCGPYNTVDGDAGRVLEKLNAIPKGASAVEIRDIVQDIIQKMAKKN